MKEMSTQKAREFWIYLRDQAELKKQAFIDTPRGSPYKDEVRAEAETYDWIIKSFDGNFEQAIRGAQDILHGLTTDQATDFINYLDGELEKSEAYLENTRRKKQEALARVRDVEYGEVKRIYKATENNVERQIMALENARGSFMNILQEN